MTIWYLSQVGLPIAFLLMSISALIIYKKGHRIAAILIGISALTISTLKIFHAISFSQDLVSYEHDAQGNVAHAIVELTLWQNMSLWADPIGTCLIAIGIFILAKRISS